MELTADTFRDEIADAVKNYDRYVVCLDKTPDEFEQALRRLMKKAIDVYVNRGPNLRHGIALDKQVTIIISQTDAEVPLCAIYFNLHSPYQKKAAAKAPSKE